MPYFTRKLKFCLFFIVIAIGFSSCKTIKIEEKAEEGVKNIVKTEEKNEDSHEIENAIFNSGDFFDLHEFNPISHFKAPKVKGLYVSSVVQNPAFMEELLEIADETEVNAFVIDVKSDDGIVTYDMNIPSVNEAKSSRVYINDIDELMDVLYEHNIYPIARIVSFKDPYLASNKHEFAIKNKDLSLWNYGGIPWINPYNKGTWDYIMDIATQAGLDGFKEIQFDYIRFEATNSLNNAYFDGLEDGKGRREIIIEYLEHVRNKLNRQGLVVSSDVFGTIITSELDAKTIGQNYLLMAENSDVICPMVYPSHYGFGYFGTPANKHADLYPYEIIKGSMEASNEVLASSTKDNVAIVRPWLQAFTAPWIGAGNYLNYDKKEVRDQIRGAYDAGLEEWIFWNASVRYDKDWFEKEDA